MAGNKLSHAEVWDDEALISSWNEALDEYKVNFATHVMLMGRGYTLTSVTSTTIVCTYGENKLRIS